MAQVLADTAQYSVLIGGQVFQVLTFHAHEEMSHLFRYSLTLRCDNPEVDIKSLVRRRAELHLDWEDKKKRWYGMVASASQINAGLPSITQEEGEYGEYAIEVVPHFWMLTQKTNCKMFQEIGTPDILRGVLDARGMAGKYKLKLTKAYPAREFCLQYRETDFAFLSRLMEEEGMFYFFWHDPEEPLDLLVISDDASGYDGCYPEDTVQFKKATGILSTDEEYLSSLTYEESAYTGQVAYRDFNYREPKKPPDKLVARRAGQWRLRRSTTTISSATSTIRAGSSWPRWRSRRRRRCARPSRRPATSARSAPAWSSPWRRPTATT